MEDIAENIRKEMAIIRDEIFRITYMETICDALSKLLNRFTGNKNDVQNTKN